MFACASDGTAVRHVELVQQHVDRQAGLTVGEVQLLVAVQSVEHLVRDAATLLQKGGTSWAPSATACREAVNVNSAFAAGRPTEGAIWQHTTLTDSNT